MLTIIPRQLNKTGVNFGNILRVSKPTEYVTFKRIPHIFKSCQFPRYIAVALPVAEIGTSPLKTGNDDISNFDGIQLFQFFWRELDS